MIRGENLESSLLSIIYGIASAVTWGAADFIGGLASKETSPYRVLFLGELAGVIPFLILAFISGETVPPVTDLLWGALGSLLGLGGLVFLYRSLASGQMTIAAPVSALFSALIPVVFTFFTQGLPRSTTLLGFALAFIAVWLISQTDGTNLRFSFSDLRMPLISGLFFGLYFIVIHQATIHAFFWPLVSARSTGILALGSFALVTRQPALPPRDLWGKVMLNGILDIGGNGFYVLAARTGRLDVSAVLGALYPASTVLLAWILLKEKIAPVQTAGILLAFGAIILMTL
jgi:drug/metabolite transporter (DMT)-like permease